MRAPITFIAITLLAMILATAQAVPAAAASVDYADPANWLCRPGREGPCSGTLTATVVASDGSMTKRNLPADPNAPIDCFYVYPTVSREPTANSDIGAGPEEIAAARRQLAPFTAKCRPYAPLYRQVTIAALDRTVHGADSALAYQDVLDAWKSYLAHDNRGRGIVLIGHSQGSSILRQLVAQEIDGKPVQQQLISAILTGTEIAVPSDGVAGGDFQHIPLCRQADQYGCVIGYSSYLASSPPDADAVFGADPAPGQMDACVDPAQLLGHKALQADLPALGRAAEALGTDFIENPDVILAQCTRSGDRNYLAISTGSGGERLEARLTEMVAHRPSWGLHRFDLSIALGDLVELAGRQSAAWAKQH
jgi:Protein of unknown function (DUF3089)